MGMKRLPDFPLIYEINTWPWLGELSERHGRRITFGDVPDEEVDRLASFGIDAVWAMGVWERSEFSRMVASGHPDMIGAYRKALPDFSAGDVIGSAYAVHRYAVDSRLGGPDGLARFRRKLAERDIRLILDFVPNHLAADHAWTREHPEYLVQGTADDIASEPGGYFALDVGGKTYIYAHGRDPYFPPWSDTVQINVARADVRRAMGEVLLDVAAQCDGVRCDMAMLVTNEVFRRTWGNRVEPDTDEEFWPRMIQMVKSRHPDFVFIAEAYWDTGRELQGQGFDFTYDKPFYDLLRERDFWVLCEHLMDDPSYQRRTLRFIENHDEERAVAAFGREGSMAAAMLLATVPGARLYHDGQFEGYRVRLPVQLGRRWASEPDHEIAAFYKRLLELTATPLFKSGTWLRTEVCPVEPGDESHRGLFAHVWALGDERRLVIVNLDGKRARGRIWLPWPELAGRRWRLHDLMGGAVFERDGDGLLVHGLYVELPPYGMHLIRPVELTREG